MFDYEAERNWRKRVILNSPFSIVYRRPDIRGPTLNSPTNELRTSRSVSLRKQILVDSPY